MKYSFKWSRYKRVKVFQFMKGFRFLEVLRGHFSKSCKSVEKTRGVGGTPLSFALNVAARNVNKIR